MFSLSILCWLVLFSLDKGTDVRFTKRGGGGKSSPAPAPEKIDPVKQAQAQLQAQINTMPGAAKVQYDILANPEYGLGATTQLQEDVRKQVFPGEQGVREQMLGNILQQLISPQGITPQQQEAQQAIRGESVSDLQRAIQTSANVGGTLYGGRRQAREDTAVGDLLNQFAVQDIDRDRIARLNAIQSALPALQMLFPGSQITQPQYVNPVVSPNQQYSGAVSQSNTAASLAAQQQMANQQSQSALYSSLFQGLGTAVGGVGGALATKWA